MSIIGDVAKGALRVSETVLVITISGVKWLNDRPPTPRLLRETFESLGATYIKLGQFIASSPSFFPASYVEEFQYCLDQTRPLPFSVIHKILTRELGDSLNAFAEIDKTALASASIAQVHAAKLKTGEEVVLKIQKPGVRNTLLTDLNFLYVGARTLEMLAPKLSWTSLSGIVKEIQQTMMEECDFYQEAAHIEEFRKFLEASEIHDVVVPKTYPALSTGKVLTMERFFGVPLIDLETIRQHCKDPERTLITAMNTWFASLTQCDFFHADVHAGNLMVLKDGRVGFIDFGIVGRIPKGTWQAMSEFISAIMVGNFDVMADSMLKIGVTKKQVDLDGLARDIKNIYKRLDSFSSPYQSELSNQSSSESGDEQVNHLLMDLVKIGEEHGIHFPRAFALLLKQFLYFDRYVHVLAPELDMFMDERLNLLH